MGSASPAASGHEQQRSTKTATQQQVSFYGLNNPHRRKTHAILERRRPRRRVVPFARRKRFVFCVRQTTTYRDPTCACAARASLRTCRYRACGSTRPRRQTACARPLLFRAGSCAPRRPGCGPGSPSPGVSGPKTYILGTVRETRAARKHRVGGRAVLLLHIIHAQSASDAETDQESKCATRERTLCE